MRPISLSISGLHSFREKQVIDFQSLREAGVFGIFGPTGSGKSSILDAITLALYGKVERAANNTQGIMNHAENNLSVSFTFEIGADKTKRRYRVERTYKRTDQLSVRISVCRLIEIEEQEIVIADKEREVTAKIQEILGLTIDDFTRAVVLPQGKFAEFLSLRGSERRKMLERLFHLEKYGEQLNQKLKEKLLYAKAIVQEIEAARAELGAASESDVEQAKSKRDEAHSHYEETKQTLAEIEKTYEKQKQLWNYQLEKQQLLTKKSELEKRQPEILQLKTKLEKAEEAKKLKPLFSEWKNLLQAVTTSEEEYRKVEQDYQILLEKTETAKANYEKIKAEYEENVPILIQNIERYKTAQQYEIEYEEAKRKQIQLEKQDETAKTKLHEELEKLQQAKHELVKINEQLGNIEKQIVEYTVEASEKERVQQAVFDKQQLMNLQNLQEKLKEEFQQKQAERNQKQAEFDKFTKKNQDIKEQGIALFHRINRHYMDVANLHSFAVQHVKKLERLKETLQASIEQKRLNELARELQSQLKIGEPCPVCGSKDHQIEATKLHSDPTATKQEQEKVNQYDAMIQKLNELVIHLSHQLSHVKQQSTAVVNQLENRNIPFQDYAGTINVQADKSVEQLSHWIIETEKLLKQDFLHIQERVKTFEEQSKQANQKLAIVQMQLSEKDKLSEETKNKFEEAVATWSEQRKKWDTTYADKSFDNIELELKKLQEYEEKRAALMNEFEKLTMQREQKNEEISQQSDAVSHAKVNSEIISNNLNRLKEEIKNQKQKLQAIVGKQSANVLLQDAQQKLEELRHAEKAALTDLEDCKRQLDQLQNRKISVREQLYQLKERKNEVTEEWQKQLEKSSFQQIEEFEKALVHDQLLDSWQEQISQFDKQWTAVMHDLKRVNDFIQGETLTEEKWEEIKQKLNKMKQAYDEAIQRKSEAEFQLKEIREKHKRFLQLENDLTKAQKVVSQLTKLESVFRGNAFVEFMAQEQLLQITKDASVRLGRLTNQRYAIEINSEGGFVIRDDANGGVRRPVSTLSGGETFLTSLALALSLSSHIQLRGKYPLEFFFLDEGFGTLDQETLETVMTSLERLHLEKVSIGIISHVPELKDRLARKLIVHPAEPAGRGTRISLSS